MAFSAVFTYNDLICLKLTILFLALGNIKTNIFIVENGKIIFSTTWSQKLTSLFQTSTFWSSIFTGLKSNKIAAELTKQLWFITSVSSLYNYFLAVKARFRTIWLFLFNLHNKCPAWHFAKWNVQIQRRVC